MSKRILVFCGGFIVSGAEVITLAYVKELLKMGNEIHFIISRWTDGDLKKRLIDVNIPYTEVKLGFIYLRRPLWTLDSLIHYPGAVRQILGTIKKFKPDLTYHMSSRSLFMLKPFLRGTNFYHVHDVIPATRWNKFILKSILPITKRFIAVSDFASLNLQKSGINEKSISVVHNGVKLPVTPISQPNIDYNFVRIGLVGQINYSKGHHLVLKALSDPRFVNRKIILKIFGKGNAHYIADLKLMADKLNKSHQIEWCGFVSSQENLYSLIDFLIIPSINPESFGMVAIEAGISKVLVLSAESGGLQEIVKNKTTGYLFKNNDSVDIAETLNFALDNEKLNLECIELNFHNVQRNFNLASQAIILSEVLTKSNTRSEDV